MRQGAFARRFLFLTAFLAVLQILGAKAGGAKPNPSEGKTRIAIVGLDHDHVWELLKYVQGEPDAELVAIAESQPALVDVARSKVRESVKFYSAYVAMLDEAKPNAVIGATANARHLGIVS